VSGGAILDLEAANDVMVAFGAEHQRAVKSENRAALNSSLFDVPGRSTVGNILLYQEAPDLIRRLNERISPEELGARMKVPGSRPYALNHWVVMGGFVEGRQQYLIDNGVGSDAVIDDPRSDDLITVADWYDRVGRAYREDGNPFPRPPYLTQEILTPDAVAAAMANAVKPDTELMEAVKRTGASLALHNFLLHGEQRDGIFGHGPYTDDGSTVWFEEFNDLSKSHLPWSYVEPELPVSNVVFGYAAQAGEIESEANLFGVLRVAPHDFLDRLLLVSPLTQDGGELRSLTIAELEEISDLAEQRYAKLFEQAVDWTDEFRIAYGGPLFANHFSPFFDLAGDPEGAALVHERFDSALPKVLAEMPRGMGEGTFWHHLATAADGALYGRANS
jgi:hypothetical protein